jgi:hypothetical protein
VNAERRFDRGAWLTLAVVLAWAVGFLAVALAALSRPTDGWTAIGPDNATGGYRATLNMTRAPSPLRPNDIIIAIDGHAIERGQVPPLPSNPRAGQTVRYRVLRQAAPGQPQAALDVELPLVVLGPAGLLRATLLQWQITPRDYIVAAVSLLVVAIAFFLRPGNLGARYLLLIFGFYGCAVWLGGFTISALYISTLGVPFYLAYVAMGPGVWGWYFFPSLMLMALAFPVVKAPLRRFPRLLPAILYGPLLALTLIDAYAELVGDTRWMAGLGALTAIAGLLAIVTIFGALIHNWLTLREPVARAQLRWLALGLGVGLGGALSIGFITSAVYGAVPNDILWLLLLVPISVVVAITRYHLFDIDVIIRRTLIYAVLTALMALAYFGSIVVLQNTFGALTGQRESTPVTVLSTLVIWVLFVPLRRRVQAFIDRRFFRRKYDAARILAAFGTSARDDVDLDDLTQRLLGVVDETMQPDRVSLWLRK